MKRPDASVDVLKAPLGTAVMPRARRVLPPSSRRELDAKLAMCAAVHAAVKGDELARRRAHDALDEWCDAAIDAAREAVSGS